MPLVQSHYFKVMPIPSFGLYCSLVYKLLKIVFSGTSSNFAIPFTTVVWIHQTPNDIFADTTSLQGLLCADVQIYANRMLVCLD